MRKQGVVSSAPSWWQAYPPFELHADEERRVCVWCWAPSGNAQSNSAHMRTIAELPRVCFGEFHQTIDFKCREPSYEVLFIVVLRREIRNFHSKFTFQPNFGLKQTGSSER